MFLHHTSKTKDRFLLYLTDKASLHVAIKDDILNAKLLMLRMGNAEVNLVIIPHTFKFEKPRNCLS